MVYPLLLSLHVVICAVLVLLVLLQQGKGAEMGAAFGSGASATIFGASGSGNFLTRSTAVMATLFFASNLALGYVIIKQTRPNAPVIAPVENTIPETPAEPGLLIPQDSDKAKSTESNVKEHKTAPAAVAPAGNVQDHSASPAATPKKSKEPSTSPAAENIQDDSEMSANASLDENKN